MLALMSGAYELIQDTGRRGESQFIVQTIYTKDVEEYFTETSLLFGSEIMANQKSLEQSLTFFHSSQ